MNKLISSIFVLLLFLSCSVQGRRSEYIQVYKQNGAGMITPIYLTLRHYKAGYDLYFSNGRGGVLGTYVFNGDTLLLTPKYEYMQAEVSDVDTAVTITSIPIILKKSGRKLIDLTDYESYPELAPWFKNDNGYDFELYKLHK